MDILSTELGVNLSQRLREANPLMRDASTGGFLLSAALFVKSSYMMLVTAPLSWVLWKGTRSGFLASLPFIWDGYTTFLVSFHNLMLLWNATR